MRKMAECSVSFYSSWRRTKLPVQLYELCKKTYVRDTVRRSCIAVKLSRRCCLSTLSHQTLDVATKLLNRVSHASQTIGSPHRINSSVPYGKLPLIHGTKLQRWALQIQLNADGGPIRTGALFHPFATLGQSIARFCSD